MLYDPIGRRGRLYTPSPLVEVVPTVPRSISVAVTLASLIEAPDGSVIFPVMAAVTSCPHPAAVARSSSSPPTHTAVTHRTGRPYSCFPVINLIFQLLPRLSGSCPGSSGPHGSFSGTVE